MNKILKKQAVQLMNCLFFIFLCGNCLAQKAYPEIRVSYISELQKGIQDSHWILDSDLVSSPGMIPFGNGNYTDSLINHLDTIQPADWRTPKGNYPVFLAIWGNDTLSYARLPDTRFYYRNDNKQKKKIRVLEVESQLPPYTRFAADVEGLSEKKISALTDSMKRMKSPQDTLMNCPQACFSMPWMHSSAPMAFARILSLPATRISAKKKSWPLSSNTFLNIQPIIPAIIRK